jgi:hypothetical protein
MRWVGTENGIKLDIQIQTQTQTQQLDTDERLRNPNRQFCGLVEIVSLFLKLPLPIAIVYCITIQSERMP